MTIHLLSGDQWPSYLLYKLSAFPDSIIEQRYLPSMPPNCIKNIVSALENLLIVEKDDQVNKSTRTLSPIEALPTELQLYMLELLELWQLRKLIHASHLYWEMFAAYQLETVNVKYGTNLRPGLITELEALNRTLIFVPATTAGSRFHCNELDTFYTPYKTVLDTKATTSGQDGRDDFLSRCLF